MFTWKHRFPFSQVFFFFCFYHNFPSSKSLKSSMFLPIPLAKNFVVWDNLIFFSCKKGSRNTTLCKTTCLSFYSVFFQDKSLLLSSHWKLFCTCWGRQRQLAITISSIISSEPFQSHFCPDLCILLCRMWGQTHSTHSALTGKEKHSKKSCL